MRFMHKRILIPAAGIVLVTFAVIMFIFNGNKLLNEAWSYTAVPLILGIMMMYYRVERDAKPSHFELKMEHLINNFNAAWENDASFVGVLIFIPGQASHEVIINSAPSFAKKLAYYKEKYDDNLNMKNGSGIKIVGFTYGDSFSEIEKDLY